MTHTLDPRRQIHFVGIGGAGMSALAEILMARGFHVSGSDICSSRSVDALRRAGARITLQQGPGAIDALRKDAPLPPLVVISSAIKDDNPELVAIRAAGKMDVIHRSDLLADLLAGHPRSVVVAGAHGKTTTSTILSTVLMEVGLDPTVVIGGVVPWFGSNGRHGCGDVVVAEADESDGTLVKFRPRIGVITNLELDHTDHYPDIDHLLDTMATFGRNCQTLLTNGDCPLLSQRLPGTRQWSLDGTSSAHYRFSEIRCSGQTSEAVVHAGSECLGPVVFPLTGLHNLANLAAALAAALELGIPFPALQKACEAIRAPGRRFEFHSVVDGRLLVDDYAHHPTEVAATLAMARLMVGDDPSALPLTPKRVVVAFQPHRYSRTKDFLQEFALTLTAADAVLLLPIYSAGEESIAGVTHAALARAIADAGGTVHCFDSLEHLAQEFHRHTRPGDLMLAMGAGSVNRLPDLVRSAVPVAA
ncbi:UDP-N-acetylmuramate--L-alanine ligase [Candidatus Synechococcus spongiarum LMB bulk15M]|uniref:UDP-N-acetylmuramate--L-alanine ligase n=1 Tax=Candidatus Synechococcus spongiarum LMB bulk15M TaxID=1943582 RepID=A0A1T1D1G7_9SYNE|nr:UDP-N-acetylmuramate--L-alanine ligase [Candidatus Synechococcus spongiarum LMB bulk15M]